MTRIDYTPEAQQVMRDYPAWEVWSSLIGGQWHGRLKGATPPVMLHDDSPAGIRGQIEDLERKRP
jgi:hypothetical protein